MWKTRLFVLAIILIALAGAVTALQLQHPQLPKPYATPSVNNRPQVISRPDGVELKLPRGFKINVYADGFERPRFMAQGPSKEILISDSAEKGAVYILQDEDHDFKVDSKKKLIDGLDRPYGLAFWKDYLYIAETT